MSDTSNSEQPTFVLLHGFPLDRRVWDDVITDLITTRRILTPDLKGFGERAGEAVKGMSIESLADDVHARLVKLRALPCVLGGLSMGGYVALAFATKYATDLRGLILMDTKCTADTPEGKAARMSMIELVRASGTTGVVEQMLPKMLAPQTYTSREDVVTRLQTIMHTCPPTTIEAACLAMRDREDFTQTLRAIDVPVLTIVGAHDVITPPDGANAMSKLVNHTRSTVQVIQGAGHMSPLEQPEAVADAIDTFLRTL